ncbi:MAG: aminoglycoside phosphotransferase family protein [Halieaceae bacterium]|jgi:Ser/Thr protein kinase RdoA (MazF antagonist)|nr:aminoglycoside phosphotransferase family protein [Halieaceae bacterium]
MATDPSEPRQLQSVLDSYGFHEATVEEITAGLINRTLLVTTACRERYILQRLHPALPDGVSRNIERVSRQLLASGLQSPELVRTLDGATEARVDGARWRTLSYVDGFSQTAFLHAPDAYHAGRLVARFHRALARQPDGFEDHDMKLLDLDYHLARLHACKTALVAHRRRRTLLPLVDTLGDAASRLPPLPALPSRTCHGDLKVSNILFRRQDRVATCLIDLDTVGQGPLPLELGDAMRSWCNRAAEDNALAHFSDELFRNAVLGYASAATDFLDETERVSLVTGIARACLTLAVRFCVDAICEDYFAWDATRFTSHSEHSQRRAESQFALYTAVHDQRQRLTDIAGAAFSAGENAQAVTGLPFLG